MSKVSVITATDLKPDRIDWLLDLNQSLCKDAEKIEHVIAIDGDRKPPEELQGLIIPLGKNYGQAIARNLALQHATGDYITSADDDDKVPSEGLYARMNALDDNPAYGWVGGKMSNLSASGEYQDYWECLAGVGTYTQGEVFSRWSEPDGEFPLSPQSLMVRKEVLQSVGGWGGLPQAEDFSMVMAVTSVSHGEILDELVYEYRHHDSQMTQIPEFSQVMESHVRRICFERGRILANKTLV